MRLKLYQAASVAEAMSLVRAELGPEALIVSTRRMQGGVELTAAMEPADPPPERPCADFAYHGIPAGLAARLSGSNLAEALRGMLRFGALPIAREAGGSGPMLLAGLPGAGKTLSVARLATRLVLAGVQPVVITTDGRRAGAAEELASYTRLLGVTLLAASSPASLARALASHRDSAEAAPVLIDTAGVNPFDRAELAGLAELADVSNAVPVLVAPAGQHPDEAAEQAASFATLGVRHLLATRLDIARRLGSLITAALAGDFVLTEAGVGAGPAGSLAAFTPDMLADRLSAPPGPNPGPRLAGAVRPPPARTVPARGSAALSTELIRSQRYEADVYRT